MVEEIRKLLRLRYDSPRYLFIEEIANGTGAPGGRFADGLALALWPSSGMWLYGFEIKMKRTDLLRELKDPKKWRAVGSYCDYWWLVVGPDVWKQGDDLPPSWGVLEYVPERVPWRGPLQVRRRPRRQEAFPMDRPFIASLLRKGVRVDMDRLKGEGDG